MANPVILGFDPAKTTGWAYYDTGSDRSAIRCGAFEMPPKADPYYTGEQLGLKLQAMLESLPKVPNFAVIEQPFHASGGRDILGVIYGWGALYSISSICANWGIHIGTLAPATWRGMFFGSNYACPQKAVKKKVKGKIIATTENDWKIAAIHECERLGINLPSTKAAADDAAEACALAMCWEHKDMKFHAGRHHQPWIDLRQRKSISKDERTAA